MAHPEASPVGGPLLTRPFKFLLFFLSIWVVVLVWRFAAGIGAVSGLSDGYPWGVWIAFDVVTGTALACGGYAVQSSVTSSTRVNTTRWFDRRF